MNKKTIKFGEGNRYHLSRISPNDGKGDSGHMLLSVNEKGKQYTNEIRVGYCVNVGSFYARSYTWQDYWTTTPITKIVEVKELEDDSKVVIFETKNSKYKLVVS
jgi:hypothetical protein